MSGCLLCSAERITPWHFEDDECWVADCMVCATPMIVWRTHGLPAADVQARMLAHLERIAAHRYGDAGYWVDGERRRIPDHWHAHARPAGGFFDPASDLSDSARLSPEDVALEPPSRCREHSASVDEEPPLLKR